MTEQWRPIPGFPSYAVSDAGRVMRTKPTTRAVAGHIKAQWPEEGARVTHLWESNRRYRRVVNVLVRSAFGA